MIWYDRAPEGRERRRADAVGRAFQPDRIRSVRSGRRAGMPDLLSGARRDDVFARASVRSRAIRVGDGGGDRGDGDAQGGRIAGRAGRADQGPRLPGGGGATAQTAPRFQGDPLRRRARRRPADRHGPRPEGPALGRRELVVPDLAGRPARQGPHPHLRGRRRRRPVRPSDGLLRQGNQLHRDRAGLRRGLGLRHAQPALLPRPRRRRPPRRTAGRQARRLEPKRPAQPLQRPQVGPRRLALGLSRHPLDGARRQARHAGREARCR